MKLITTLPLLALPLLFACETTTHDHVYHDHFGTDPKVSDDVYVYVPQSDRDDVNDARTESMKMQDSVAQAQHEVDVEAQQLDVARSELNNAEDGVDTARREYELSRETAQKDHDDRVDEAQKRLDAARQRWHAAAANVAWHEAHLDQLKADVTLAKLRVDLANAKVELAKAKAVSKLDRPEIYGLPLNDFEASVQDHETRIKMAEVDADAWKKKVELRQKALEDRKDKVKDAG
ncbi:MAG TPA: hypothetical protein VFY71_04830 [Planctomycetota bacterium]|nr:hypothetical protein [Planctomycetota bacterium]